MTDPLGVVVYGPPASGKDTVTRELVALNAGYHPFARIKVGAGRTNGYRMSSRAAVAALEASGDVVYANTRYGNTYVVDRQGLGDAFAVGVPVVQLGQIQGIEALVDGYRARWLRVLLWCPQEVTAARSADRGDDDTAARVAAWTATQADLDLHRTMPWDIRMNTATVTPPEAARGIDLALNALGGAARL